MAIVIATDSTGNILPSEAKELGVKVIPLNIVFEEGTYKEDVEISSKEFYKRLVSEKTLPKTSQPSPSEFLNLFEEVKRNNDELILITLASDLSGTY